MISARYSCKFIKKLDSRDRFNVIVLTKIHWVKWHVRIQLALVLKFVW